MVHIQLFRAAQSANSSMTTLTSTSAPTASPSAPRTSPTWPPPPPGTRTPSQPRPISLRTNTQRCLKPELQLLSARGGRRCRLWWAGADQPWMRCPWMKCPGVNRSSRLNWPGLLRWPVLGGWLGSRQLWQRRYLVFLSGSSYNDVFFTHTHTLISRCFKIRFLSKNRGIC